MTQPFTIKTATLKIAADALSMVLDDDCGLSAKQSDALIKKANKILKLEKQNKLADAFQLATELENEIESLKNE
ncbi:hypothetical protein ACFOOP_14225 [Marinicaulis aureus]|uniref:DUF1843 domain-containing protein n=1 Tax=Hyphococcus aureus TaxID=2666033 RepID=A0ABW1KY06_9PROT